MKPRAWRAGTLPAPEASETPSSMQLTDGQNKALDDMLAFARNGKSYFTLAGHAGTGKTTLTKFFAEQFPDGSIAFTAPTNKATRVLRETVDTDHAFTVQSANGLMLMDDREEKYLAKAGKGKVEDYSLIIVDEASMVGSSLFSQIEWAVEHYGTKFLFVGDPLQLPPVRDGGHVAFTLPGFELTQVVRQAEDNPIIRLAVFFRKLLRGEAASMDQIPQSAPGVDGVHFCRGDFYNRMLEKFALTRLPGFEITNFDVRGVAWRNNTVDAMAARIRRGIYGDDVADFVAGERVFTKKPLGPMYTDQEAKVTAVEDVAPHPEYPEIRAVPVALETDGTLSAYGFAVYPEDKPLFEKQRDARRKNAMKLQRKHGHSLQSRSAWKDFHVFNDSFAELSSVHALTAHRSQGSTFEEVFVDMADIRGCRDADTRYRLLYVACTRARHNVYLRE